VFDDYTAAVTLCPSLLAMQMCQSGNGFKRVTCFNFPGAEQTMTLVVWDRNHYDYLWLTDTHGQSSKY